MQLYAFTLEIQDGVNSYEQTEFVLAPDDRTAALFAHEYARHWKPNATYDEDVDVYSAPDGWPQWTLARCKPMTYLSVPIAGQRNGARGRVALMPEVITKT